MKFVIIETGSTTSRQHQKNDRKKASAYYHDIIIIALFYNINVYDSSQSVRAKNVHIRGTKKDTIYTTLVLVLRLYTHSIYHQWTSIQYRNQELHAF
jgi:hypothetical protein